MFLVEDDRKKRSKQIRSLMDTDVSIAMLAAVADFEWTYRRCVLALGKSPTRTIREKILFGKTFKDYTRIWNEEVYPRVKRRLSEFSFSDNQLFTLHNRITYGELHAYGFIPFDYKKKDVEEVLLASEKLTALAEEYEEPLYGNRIIYNKPR